ncbi:5-methyltetrahydropteroyltriglutamate--homocysteine S-methyltransferase [bacterium]|nr:5-methyltetrahydropteroyltriglutamate--homocysteine S-methyltransferase [bacterium]
MSNPRTHNLGFSRIGPKRELKKGTEAYWKGQIPLKDLEETGKRIRRDNWELQKRAGIDLIPSNDFSFYDQMLDMICLLGAIPPRFGNSGEDVTLDMKFRMARGMARTTGTGAGEPGAGEPAMEMTKWFDTNYHYLVPEFFPDMQFRCASDKVFDEFQEALDLGIQTMPVLIGPVTFLYLGKMMSGHDRDKYRLLDRLIPLYGEILGRLEALGAEWVQLDEPVFSLELDPSVRDLFHASYHELAGSVRSLKLMTANYFGDLRENLDSFISLPVQALHIDAVRGAAELETIAGRLPEGVLLSAGVIDGRNIWKNDYQESLNRLQAAARAAGPERIMVSPSCSLMHVPVTLRHEPDLDDEIRDWMAFGEEKLEETAVLARILHEGGSQEALSRNRASHEKRASSPRIHRPAVKSRMQAVRSGDLNRKSPYAVRREKQRRKHPLPDFPTTTIGSFPQTPEVRQARLKWRRGEWTEADYTAFIRSEITKTIRIQEDLDLDVLVHGESERNDMVEFFGEQLEGYLFTRFGWVQSYGSRYVKPPVIFGDIQRTAPMTVAWSGFAQSLTRRPVKGMLTGPVTMLEWSFVRNDQPRADTCRQIALAIRDEVRDLEKAGIHMIQIDEPALREGLPLRQPDWAGYLKWAVENYRLATTGVADETQIHTHMCYSEFNDIIDAIAALDTDVISIESSRSKMELLQAFVDFKYPSEIGPGIYDIHSPRIPAADEITALLEKAVQVLPSENLWVNPDCGLKTRQWDEVIPALKHMVESAKRMRSETARTLRENAG